MSVRKLAVVESQPVPIVSEEPMRASWSEMASDERVAVPSSSMSEVREARPALPSGSPAAPIFITRFMLTTGNSWCSTTSTSKPFESLRRCTAGMFIFGSGFGVGRSDVSTDFCFVFVCCGDARPGPVPMP